MRELLFESFEQCQMQVKSLDLLIRNQHQKIQTSWVCLSLIWQI